MEVHIVFEALDGVEDALCAPCSARRELGDELGGQECSDFGSILLDGCETLLHASGRLEKLTKVVCEGGGRLCLALCVLLTENECRLDRGRWRVSRGCGRMMRRVVRR